MVFLVVIFFMSVSFAPLSASQREAYRIPPRRPAFSYHLCGELFLSLPSENRLFQHPARMNQERFSSASLCPFRQPIQIPNLRHPSSRTCTTTRALRRPRSPFSN